MNILRRVSQTFAPLAKKFHQSFPPTSFGVMLHKKTEWDGNPEIPDYGYLSINAELTKGGYEVTRQSIRHFQPDGVSLWHGHGEIRTVGSGRTLEQAIKQIHTCRQDHLNELDESGRPIWTDVKKGTSIETLAKRHDVSLARNPLQRKSLNEIKEVLG